MRINFRLQIQCLALAGIMVLAGCGGSDGSSTPSSKSAQAPTAASDAALAPPTAPIVADASINKSVPPVELPGKGIGPLRRGADAGRINRAPMSSIRSQLEPPETI